MRKLIVCMAAVAMLLAVPVFAQSGVGTDVFAPQAELERATTTFDRAAATEAMQVRHGWLAAQQVRAAMGSAARVEVTDAELSDVWNHNEPRQRVGIAKDVNFAIAPGFDGFGATRMSRDGFVWTGVVRSPGAAAMRLHFDGVDLPQGVELYIYNTLGEAFGPYTGRGLLGSGDFWAQTLVGDEALVQLHYRGADVRTALEGSSLRIAGVAHLTEAFQLAVSRRAALTADKAFCSFNESCVENASCSSMSSAVNAAQDAVAHMQFVISPYVYICTGGLLNDTASSGTPYFLTANHCLSSQSVANSLETFFQFTTPCGGSCYNPDGAVPSMVGSTLLATNSSTDFTFLQLSGSAPAGSAFLGWTTSAVAYANGLDLYRISHPAGAPQAYSEQSVNTSYGTCGTLPRGNFIYSQTTYAGTEGGSSGSPVVNSSGQVVGQLYGRCGTNINNACDHNSNATVDGAFAVTYGSISQWLDPGSGCTDSDGDGSCASVDCDDSDATAYPGAAELCGDSVDNDCDGSVDEGCSACLANGAWCSVNADCCSNKCQGWWIFKTCRP